MFKKVISLGLFLQLLVSCGDVVSPDSSIADTYADQVRRLGLTPVYPPRENLQVGDLFIVSTLNNAETQGVVNHEQQAAVLIGSLPRAVDLANGFLATRMAFDRTNLSQNALTAEQLKSQWPKAPHQVDIGSSIILTRDNQLIDTLPIAAFPSIKATVGRNGAGGVANLLAGLGIAGGRRTDVTLNFHQVRTIFVPISDMLTDGELLSYAGRKIDEISNVQKGGTHPLAEMLRQKLVQNNTLFPQRNIKEMNPCSNAREVNFAAVNHVYLTRKITYTYSNSNLNAVGLQIAKDIANKPTTGAIADLRPVIDAQNAVTDENGTTFPGLQTQMAALENRVAALSAGPAGGALRFESWNALGITLSEEFTRPIAIAYDSVSLKEDISRICR